MKYSWTTELFGYALRGSDTYPRALLTGTDEGWHASLLESGMPSSGPYKQQTKAAEWAQGMLLRDGHILPDSTFGEFPFRRGLVHPQMPKKAKTA